MKLSLLDQPRLLLPVCLLLFAGPRIFAQDRETGASKLPPPDLDEVAYGTNARNVMDVWFAPSSKVAPAPLLLYFHGGGFSAGSKENLPQVCSMPASPRAYRSRRWNTG